MKSIRTINVVGAHAEGEVGCVIVGGVLPPSGTTLEGQRQSLMRNDELRQFLIREPRGGVFTHYNLIVPPTHPQADAGFIIMEPCEYPPMSGTNAMCVATVLLETGMLPITEEITEIVLEAPGGLVRARCECDGQSVTAVTLRNVPSYIEQLDRSLTVPGIGAITVDLAYGGDFFALVDTRSIDLDLTPENARRIVEVGEAIKAAARVQCPFVHPEMPELGIGPNFVMFGDPFEIVGGRLSARGANIISPGKIDRSPCGTGSSARLAALHARGLIQLGEVIQTTSILGTCFECSILEEAQVAGRPAIVPAVKGSAWITGYHTYLLDPDDPFHSGYALTDTAYQTY